MKHHEVRKARGIMNKRMRDDGEGRLRKDRQEIAACGGGTRRRRPATMEDGGVERVGLILVLSE